MYIEVINNIIFFSFFVVWYNSIFLYNLLGTECRDITFKTVFKSMTGCLSVRCLEGKFFKNQRKYIFFIPFMDGFSFNWYKLWSLLKFYLCWLILEVRGRFFWLGGRRWSVFTTNSFWYNWNHMRALHRNNWSHLPPSPQRHLPNLFIQFK